MTEKETELKWCPMVRMNTASDNGSNVGAFNRDGGDSFCIGRQCMMFRRISDDIHDYYCGLAGSKGVL